MAGELVKIGAKRGAMVLWTQILKILIAKGVPTKVLENLVWDLITDMISDATKEKGNELKLGNLGSPATYTKTTSIGVPPDAVGFVVNLTAPGRYGKTFGGNGAPDVWLFNPWFASIGGYGWQTTNGANYEYKDFTYAKEVVLTPLPLRPAKLNLYLADSCTANIQWQKRK